jgi:hypothetical protein
MTLALFILGLLLILGIARYNESNKLFWTLSIAYILGFACTKMVYDSFSTDEQSEQSLNQAYPTQGLLPTANTFVLFNNADSYTTDVKVTSKPVGQAITPDYIEPLFTLSNVSGATQGLTLHILPNPPNKVDLVDTS